MLAVGVHYRKLGVTDLEVSEISLGSWLTFAGGVAQEQARACTEAALDVGITLFDTANVYGHGAAEEIWGAILSEHPRSSYLLATKVWGPMSDHDRGLSADQISKQLDASLRRLRTDYVDLYQAHRFDISVPLEETVEGFRRVVDEGKARYVGFSEWTPRQIRAAVDLAGPGLFVASQPQYSMLWRAPEAEVFGLCAEHGISQVVWSPLAQGVLTGKYRPGQPVPEDSRFAHEDMSGSKDLVYRYAVLEAVQRLVPIAEDLGISLSTLALAWVLRGHEVSSAITGASRPEQVRANAAASGVRLPDNVLGAIDRALGDVPVTEPTLAPFATEGVLRR